MNHKEGKYGKDLDTSFTIPRKKEDVEDEEVTHQANTVLANAYVNIPNNTCQYSNSTHINSLYERRPHISSTNNGHQSSMKRTWTNANASSSNTSQQTTTYKDSFRDLHDSSLPKELLALFQPLFCKLCLIQFPTTSMAKLHYKSKNHDKKLRNWLIEYSEETGQPLHKRATLPRLKKGQEYDPKYFHCDVCDLHLTGKIHAESHYMGRNHQRALLGKKNPAGKGFYNDEGKWTRTVAAKDDKTGRDGFGQDFALQEQKILKPPNNSLRCEICDVAVTSMPQMTMHLEGQKHRKKMKQVEEGAAVTQQLISVQLTTEPVKNDPDMLSSYRTPSGHFYCKTCNVSLNSEMQFIQHLKSKKHAKKSVHEEVPPEEDIITQSSDDLFMHL